MKLPPKKTVSIDKVQPYLQNPRLIPDEAVEQVRVSIEEYGYVQPILVDSDHVIIAGHTRFLALKALGHKKVQVYVSDMPEEQARKYRLVDNRVHELSDWAHDKLVVEAREWEDEILQRYFPEMDLDVGSASAEGTTEDEIKAAEDKVGTITQAQKMHMTDVHCPACKDVFQVKTVTLPGLTPADVDELLSD